MTGDRRVILIRAIIDTISESQLATATEFIRDRNIDIYKEFGLDWYKRLHEETPHFITVVNLRDKGFKPSNRDVYIGRPNVSNPSVLGNPWTHHQNIATKAQFVCQTREESIKNYQKYLKLELAKKKPSPIKQEMSRIYRMALNGGVRLTCFCVPQACHGEVIKRFIEEKIVERMNTVDFQDNS